MATPAPGPVASTGSPQFRYRNGAEVSGWMSAEQLKEAARRGALTAIGLVQQAGQADWVPASGVRGLFPAETRKPEDAAAEPAAAAAAPGAELNAHGRHLRFGTLKEVLAAFLNADVEIVEQSAAHVRRLVAVGSDHFECLGDSPREREFVPYGCIARLVTVESAPNGHALAYRDSHRLRVMLAAG